MPLVVGLNRYLYRIVIDSLIIAINIQSRTYTRYSSIYSGRNDTILPQVSAVPQIP